MGTYCRALGAREFELVEVCGGFGIAGRALAACFGRVILDGIFAAGHALELSGIVIVGRHTIWQVNC